MQSRAAEAELSKLDPQLADLAMPQTPEPSISEGDGAAVISLAHARGSDACMPSSSSEERHACIAVDFDELVRPVGLVGPNREVCRAAYLEAPIEFAALVDDALQRGHVPAALLVRRVKDGDHRKLAARSLPKQPTLAPSEPSLLERRLAEEGRG